jgi:hypothetical protein
LPYEIIFDPLECLYYLLQNRTLSKADSTTSQGVVMLWVDIFTLAEAVRTPAIVIEKPTVKEFEIRIVCWRSLEIPNLDGWEEVLH